MFYFALFFLQIMKNSAENTVKVKRTTAIYYESISSFVITYRQPGYNNIFRKQMLLHTFSFNCFLHQA